MSSSLRLRERSGERDKASLSASTGKGSRLVSRTGSHTSEVAAGEAQSDPDMIPNVPDPINGMIKTYDFSHRSFQRPYSAKTVFFYKDGDQQFRGVRLPVSKSRYRNMESLLDDLNARVPLDFGVRRVFTPSGKREIQDPDHLQHLGMYVCSSSKWARSVRVGEMAERSRRGGEAKPTHRRVRSHNDSLAASSSAAAAEKEGLRRVLSTTTPPLAPLHAAKQLLFVLQSQPKRVYRVLLRPQRPTTFAAFIAEVSQGLQLPIHKIYTMDLKKMDSLEALVQSGQSQFLALERHERAVGLNSNGRQRFPPLPASKRPHASQDREQRSSGSTVESLPPIPHSKANGRPPRPPNAKSPRRDKAKGAGRKRKEEAGKRPPPADPAPDEKAASKIQAGARGFLARKQMQQPKSPRKPPRRSRSPRKPDKPPDKTTTEPPKRERKKKERSKRSSKASPRKPKKEGGEAAAAKLIQAGARGYLTRKRFRKNQSGQPSPLAGRRRSGVRVEAWGEEKAAGLIQRCFRRWLAVKRRRRLARLGTSRDLHTAATRIQAAYRGSRARKETARRRRAKENVRAISPSKARRASIKIQSLFRGYKTRKFYQRPKELYFCWTPVPQPEPDFGAQEMAATQIQSAFRGYKVRQELRAAPDPKEKTVRARRMSLAPPPMLRRPSVYYVDVSDDDSDQDS